jgi:hypothetical protein
MFKEMLERVNEYVALDDMGVGKVVQDIQGDLWYIVNIDATDKVVAMVDLSGRLDYIPKFPMTSVPGRSELVRKATAGEIARALELGIKKGYADELESYLQKAKDKE